MYYVYLFTEKDLIEDLHDDWLISLKQEAIDEDIRAVALPRGGAGMASIFLTIHTDGYEIYENISSCRKGRVIEVSQDQAAQDNEKLTIMQLANTNLSDEKLRLSTSYYRKIFIAKIINNTDYIVNFYNLENATYKDINPRASEENFCQGYLPRLRYVQMYEITYYNTRLKKEKKILIKDLDEDWLTSFYQEGNNEDIREVRPYSWDSEASLTTTFWDSGYKVHQDGKRKGGMFWQPV